MTLRNTLSFTGALVPMLLALVVSANALAQEKKPDPLQIARGAKAWAENCGRCHNIRSPSEVGDKEWHVSVAHMRVRANLPGNVARDIKAFLQSSN